MKSIGDFIAENLKTTRAFLKLIGARTPLNTPLQEIRIAELNINTDAAELPAVPKNVIFDINPPFRFWAFLLNKDCYAQKLLFHNYFK